MIMNLKKLFYVTTILILTSTQTPAQMGSIIPDPSLPPGTYVPMLDCYIPIPGLSLYKECVNAEAQFLSIGSGFGKSHDISSLNKPESNVLFSESDMLGDLQIIEEKSNDTSRIYTSFKSNISGKHFNSILIINNQENVSNIKPNTIKQDVSYTLILNFKNGQVILDKDTISTIAADGYSNVSLNEFSNSKNSNKQFSAKLNAIMDQTLMSEFKEYTDYYNISSEMELILGNQKSWACAGATVALAAATIGLTLALAGTAATAGGLTPAVVVATGAFTAASVNYSNACESSSIEDPDGGF